MSTKDKAKNVAEKAKGKVKETAGRTTGDRSMQAEGKGEQVKAGLKQAAEKVKDAAKDATAKKPAAKKR
ncbi:CsbD family protein [Actinospica durhamensis]|uniref:CsbD family protein n=1 Tax=Actinospica durhamensis TaxID=1508375 RepID=A0A941EQ32_9ACTN|nr:CsbD family protein [Actinospica durhamensis]MBR7833079.1 CsbD family protein [Actinospica durhamensis]